MNVHDRYMRMAIELAKKAEGMTSPNPLVGAVIVKGGAVAAKGYHAKCGLPHAEVNAIRMAGTKAKGATLYVTLEPCDHFGRTPPCTDAIIESGIIRVVIAMSDPNPVTNGRGIKKLRRHGISVTTGVLEEDASAINKPYIKFITTGMPYVTIKTAETLDGKIATSTGDSKWVSGEDSRRYVHQLRRKSDAVMVGVNTVLKDDPLLKSKAPGRKQPVRIIVDSGLKTPLSARVFTDAREAPVIIATARDSSKIKKYEHKGAEVIVAGSKKDRVDLVKLLKILGRRGITNILAEGGGELNAGLLAEGLADRLLFFIAPKIAGGRDAITPVEGLGVARMKDAVMLKNMYIKNFKNDILVEAEVG
jgi:diaminohydroxyphosphoribosylaminopyrimidine deaminase/5-amino-6-(5-phosphoribosylamino)uracil reductase